MKHKKMALFQSLISLLLCFSMLVGTTFAWFTDGVSSGTNMIAAGNLDIEMEYLDADGSWKKVDENTEVLDKEALWEPGYTEVAYLKISNAGSLALKYALGIGVLAETGSVNIEGEDFKLSEHIRFGLVESETPVTYADRITARNALTTSKAISEGYSTEYTLNQNGDVRYVALVVYMPEEVGNAANYATGATPPEIKLGIELVATQADYESDSFGTGYDTDAEMPGFSFPQNIFGDNTSSDVTTDDENKVATGITIEGANTNAVIPAGVQLEEGTEKLTLEVTSMNQSGANVTLSENEAMRSLNVHVQGVSADNTVPMEIYIKEAAAKGLNAGNLKLYHVENGATVEMTAVDTFTAHNQFKYDPATGDITLYMATFSEVTLVADTTAAWNGGVDDTWYTGKSSPYTIANADQLYAFARIVGEMDGNARDSFAGKTINLISNINLNDAEASNTDKIFYPIGYYYDGSDSTVQSFEGVFDGQGHTVSNFYQNTWEIKGDYDGTYYKDAMGLFGYVVNGTVKNLTVSNFSSDGEFTPTGVIAAYAAGTANFQNIAIVNCNPRVYNTGNGGIIGIAGNSNGGDTITLSNITVDNSNKISALWGSYDVACGGLVGMFRGNDKGSEISFKNCHVAAQMDVYNDVCGNYQYYAYRYAGMIIGSVRNNVEQDGKTIPNMAGISAEGCTVNYGNWNDYYYCEFEKNGHPSYAGDTDYKFSRVDKSELNFNEDGTVTCTHKHSDVEDNRAIYLPFHQLFTGYSWGVSSIGLEEYSGIVTDLGITEDKEHNTSVEKFEKKFTEDFLYRVGTKNTVDAGTLFVEKTGLTNDVVDSGVYVSITAQHDDDIVMGTFTPNTSEWEKGKIQFTQTGIAKVTIQDYDYCTPTVLYVEVVDAKNITSATGSNGTDVVLLNNVKISSGDAVHYQNCTVYGNGFEFDVRGGMNQYNSKQGHGIIIAKNATLDHLRIVGDVYDEYGMYTSTFTGDAQNDYTGAVDATNCVIQNCYIANCATPIRSNGNTIIDTTLYGGTVANLLISGGTNTLTNVTTINYNDDRGVIGMGIVITDGASENTKLILNGYLKQHNYVYETDVSEITVDEAKTVFNSMFENQFSAYHIGSNPKAVNTGIISINEAIDFDSTVLIDNADTGYEIDNDVTVTFYAQGFNKNVGAAVASVPGNGSSVDNNYENGGNSQGDYLPTFELELGDYFDANDGENDTRYCYESDDNKTVRLLYEDGKDPFTFDLSKLASVTKFGYSLDTTVICKNSDGTILATNSSVTLKDAGMYSFEISVNDNIIYGADGKLTGESVPRTYVVNVELSVKKASWKNAEITMRSPSNKSGYNSSKYYVLNFLEAINVTDYAEDGTKETVNLKAEYSGYEISYVNTTSYAWSGFTLTINYKDNRTLTVTFGAPSDLSSPGASAGGKTISLKSDDTYGYLLQSDGKINTKVSGTWPITKCTFKGANTVTVENNDKIDIDVDKSTTIKVSSGSGNNSNDGGCVTGDTLVTLADGSKKMVKDIDSTDNLLVWDFFNGKYTSVPAALVINHGAGNYDVVTLTFEDGTVVNAVEAHAFFDADANRFVMVDPENAQNYVGHSFIKATDNGYEAIKLVDVVVSKQNTESYSLVSSYHYNFIVEDMFSMTNLVPALIAGLEVGENMKFDEAILHADIDKYGLYTYADFADYMTEAQFNAFSGEYLKISVGKGYITYDGIVDLIIRFVNS